MMIMASWWNLTRFVIPPVLLLCNFPVVHFRGMLTVAVRCTCLHQVCLAVQTFAALFIVHSLA